MAVVVSCVALVISILAVAMVGVTLGLSHMMESERVGGEFFTFQNSNCYSKNESL